MTSTLVLIRGLPAAAIERMRARWEPIDQHKVV